MEWRIRKTVCKLNEFANRFVTPTGFKPVTF